MLNKSKRWPGTELSYTSMVRDLSSTRPAVPCILTCIQINLRHSKTASSALAQVNLDLNIDVALIQETYAFSVTPPVLANIPPGFSPFHQLSADHAYGTAILLRDSQSKDASLSSSLPPNISTCITLPTCSGPFSFCSAYLRPSLSNFHQSASLILGKSASPLSIICAISGALETLILHQKLNIVNKPRADLQFIPGGSVRKIN